MKHVEVRHKTTVDKKTYYGGVRLVDDSVAQTLVDAGDARYLSDNDNPQSKPQAKPLAVDLAVSK